MNRRTIPILSLCAAALALVQPTTIALAKDLDILKQNTDRWIDIRSRASKEEAAWIADQVILGETIKTLEASRAALEGSVEYHQAQSRDIAAQSAEAEAKLAAFEQSNAFLAENVHRYEQRLSRLAPSLPQPLLDSIQPLIAKFPPAADDASTPLPNRLQNVVAVMTMIDEFNNQLTLANTIRTLENGDAIEVRVLYWGLAAAYAASADAAQAWILRPSPDGWTWNPAPAEALAISQLFDVYDKRVDPALVPIPFHLAQKGGAQ